MACILQRIKINPSQRHVKINTLTMLLDTIQFRVAGNDYLLIDFGTQSNLQTNLRAIALARALLQSPTLGPQGIGLIRDAVPSFTSLLVHYDSQRLTLHGIVDVCRARLRELKHPSEVKISSRLIHIPVVYSDRWTRACYEDYCQTIKPIEPNIELVARLNGLDSAADVITAHTQCQWWVGAVGFMAGLPTLMPLAPSVNLMAPKYDPPRTWTPQGTIGLAGGLTTIYPRVIPDGYQMLGRTPVNIFQPQPQPGPFKKSPVLFQVGDRVQFYSISEAEFEAIEVAVNAGEFHYDISPPQAFCLKNQHSEKARSHLSRHKEETSIVYSQVA